jgi:ADP-heptose:LPS heptosyltransferase
MTLVETVRNRSFDEAVIFTSFHQSPLPAALVLRLAGVPVVAAICEDYPGSLLDVRHRVDDDLHEVERALSLAATLGYSLPSGDCGEMRIRPVAETNPVPWPEYVVIHPGASVPARAWAPELHAELVRKLVSEGHNVVVTGGPEEATLTARVCGPPSEAVVDLGGKLSIARLARVLKGAGVVVVGNTGPAHLAAAVGTPVVSLFAPTVPAARWRPWGVPQVLLGDQQIPCAGCRARRCPYPGHPCLSSVRPDEVVAAVTELLSRNRGPERAGAGAEVPV